MKTREGLALPSKTWLFVHDGGQCLNSVSRKIAKSAKGKALRATTKAGYAGVVCDDFGRDHGGGMVNKFPACAMCPPHPCGTFPAVAGHECPPFRRDTKRPLRGLHEKASGWPTATSFDKLPKCGR